MSTVSLDDSDIDDVLFMREFIKWYSGLSQPARNQLCRLPREVRLSIARAAVEHRLIHEVIKGVEIAPVFLDDHRPLRVA